MGARRERAYRGARGHGNDRDYRNHRHDRFDRRYRLYGPRRGYFGGDRGSRYDGYDWHDWMDRSGGPMTNPPNIALTKPSGFPTHYVIARDGNVYNISLTLGTLTVPYSVAPQLVAAGFVAGAIS